jgi:hypothetical protein
MKYIEIKEGVDDLYRVLYNVFFAIFSPVEIFRFISYLIYYCYYIMSSFITIKVYFHVNGRFSVEFYEQRKKAKG